jgi:hypothetical protein
MQIHTWYGNSGLQTYPEKVPDFRIYLIALRCEGVIIPQKNCCSRIIKKLMPIIFLYVNVDNKNLICPAVFPSTVILLGITLIRPKKNICLFTVTRPTLFSAATLVHFIGKSKVKVDTSEIFGLKKTVK